MSAIGMSKKAQRAARKASRGGQNKRADVVRYENGRIDYGATEKASEITATARRNRLRLPGVTAANVQTKTAGSAVGRMYLAGEINQGQMKAAEEFAKRRANYLAAIQAPRAPRSGSDLGYLAERLSSENMPEADPVRVFRTEDEMAEYVAKRKALYQEVRLVVMRADPLGLMAMEQVAVDDKQAVSDVTMGAFRVACNAVARMLKQDA